MKVMKKFLLGSVLLGVFSSNLFGDALVFTSGATSKTFYQVANNIKSISPVDMEVKPSKGSVENLYRVAKGEAGIGLTFADAYYQFKKQNKGSGNVQIIGTAGEGCLYVATNGKVDSEDDLQKEGINVAVGKRGAGANSTWEVAGMLDKGYLKPSISYDGDATAIQKLGQGSLDAVLQMQSPSVENKIITLVNNFNKTNSEKLKFIDFNDYSLNDKLENGKPIYEYKKIVVEKGTFSDTKVETICTPALVIVNTDLVDEDTVDDLTEMLILKSTTILNGI